MEKRTLGNSGIDVAPLAFGGNVFGWTINEQSSFKLLDAFAGAGFNLIDTADVYSNWVPGNKGGESETIIGKWLKQSGQRGNVVIASKVGGEMSAGKKGLSKAHIISSVEASLRRLQTDYIDLYQSHYDDPATPMEETFETYADLIKSGKVKAIGASNFSAERLLKALEVSEENGYPSYQTFQPLYNLYDREPFEKDFEPICREKNLAVINYYSLASGFLTGKYHSKNDLSKSPRGHGVEKYLTDRGLRILDALEEVSKNYHVTSAEIAIAWLLQRTAITAPIASATSIDQLNELIKATELQLDSSSVELLDKASVSDKN